MGSPVQPQAWKEPGRREREQLQGPSENESTKVSLDKFLQLSCRLPNKTNLVLYQLQPICSSYFPQPQFRLTPPSERAILCASPGDFHEPQRNNSQPSRRRLRTQHLAWPPSQP